MAGTSMTFDSNAFHDVEEEEIDHDEVERQAELRQLLSEGLGELSDNENESVVSEVAFRMTPQAEQPYYGEDQWQYSAYPDEAHYAYQQQQQDGQWNGAIEDEDQPWPANRIQPWSGAANVYSHQTAGDHPEFSELQPDDPNSSQQFIDSQNQRYHGDVPYTNSGNVYANGEQLHYIGEQNAYGHPSKYAGDESSPYAYQTLSGELADSAYVGGQYEEEGDEHYAGQYDEEGQYEVEHNAYEEEGGDDLAQQQQQYAMASTRLLTMRDLPVQQWNHSAGQQPWTTSASSAPSSDWAGAQDSAVRVTYTPHREAAAAGGYAEPSAATVQRSGGQHGEKDGVPHSGAMDGGRQVPVSGAAGVLLSEARTLSDPINGAAVTPQPSAPLSVVASGGIDYLSKQSQRSPKSSQASGDKLQEEFLNPDDVSAVKQRWTQLEILYSRRGLEIEQLRSEVRQLTDQKERDERVLNHRITLLQGEKDGLAESGRQCQLALSQAQSNGQELTGKVAALQKTIDTLRTANEELTKRLHTAEASEESLHAQLQAVAQSDALVRARQQHESVVNSITHKMDAELHGLREKLDATEKQRDDLDSEVLTLRAQLSKLQRAQDAAIVDHSTTVAQLAKNVEDLRQQLLARPDAAIEVSVLKQRLHELEAENKALEKSHASLQNAVRELRSQNLSLAEGDSRRQQQQHRASMDDSYSDLAIKPKISSTAGTAAGDSLVTSHTRTTQTQHTDSNQVVKEMLVRVEADVERLEQANAQLRRQMAELVDEADRDKQAALDKCEKVWQEHLTETSRQVQQQCEEQAEARVKAAEAERERQLHELRISMAEVQRQLADTKELYINMCHEKNALEEKLLKGGDVGRASLEKKHADVVKQLQGELTRLQRLLEEKVEQVKVREAEYDRSLREAYDQCEANMKQQQEEHQRALQHALKQARAAADSSKSVSPLPINGLPKKTTSRTYADQTVQTDVDKALHKHYRAALVSMKSHVMEHLKASQSREAKVLQEEMLRYRLMFARNFYSVIIQRLTDNQTLDKSAKDHMLEYLSSLLQSSSNSIDASVSTSITDLDPDSTLVSGSI